MVRLVVGFLIATLSLGGCVRGGFHAAAAPPDTLPLVSITDFEYLGGYRFPASKYGTSELNFSFGPIEYNPDNDSVFLVGHAQHQHLAEFKLPKIVNSTSVSALNIASAPLQNFVSILDRANGGNPQNINRFGGIRYVRSATGPGLLINAWQYYDAAADNTHTTLALRDATAIASSVVDGHFIFKGGVGHTSGWISPIPTEWQPILAGTHITGQSSGNYGIWAPMCSVGPSAFAFDVKYLVGQSNVPSPIPTTTLLDFSRQNPLHSDLLNNDPTNDLWNYVSRAVYGFILPGSRTYITLGNSGGHNSGVCSNCTRSDGKVCVGHCAKDATDRYRYYWLWDVNDLVAVKAGTKRPYEVKPYEYGLFPQKIKEIAFGGGSYDPASNTLYMTLQRADTLQGTYANPPVVVAYRIKVTP